MQPLRIALVLFTLSTSAVVLAETASEARERGTVERILESRRVSLDLDSVPLRETLALLRELTGVNLVLSPTVQDDSAGGEHLVTLKVVDLSARSVLDLILELNQLERTVQHGVILVTDQSARDEKPTLRMYDVRDIIMVVRDFPGPNIELADAQEDGVSIVLTGGDEPVHRITDEDTLVSLVEGNIDPESWSKEGRSIVLRNGLLIVRQGEKQHEQILELLGDLRGNG